MSSLMIILDVFVILGLVVSAILAVHFEKLLSAVIALSISGVFAAAAFLIMHAPGRCHLRSRGRCGTESADLYCGSEKDPGRR